MSARMFGTELPRKKFRVLIHFLESWVSISQKPRTGLHENMETESVDIPQAMTKAPIALVARKKFLPTKISR